MFRLAATVVALAFVVGSASSQPSVAVVFAAPSLLTLHEPVVVTATIRNELKESVQLDLGWNRIVGFGIVIRQPDGLLRRPTLTPNGVGLRGRTTLAPGESTSQPLVLNDWQPFDRPGLYQVQITLTAPIRRADGTALRAPAPETLDIRVGARDEAVLRNTYQRVADDFTHSESVEKYNAGRVLRHVTDPVGIPILRNVLDATETGDPIVIEALRRIGTLDAQRVLRELARSDREERAALARDALQRMTIR